METKHPIIVERRIAGGQMTPDQMATLTTLVNEVKHMSKAIDELRVQTGKMLTKEDLLGLAARHEVTSLKERVETLEKKVEANNASSLWEKIIKVFSQITWLSSGLGVLYYLWMTGHPR